MRDAERQRLRGEVAALDEVKPLTARDRNELREELEELLTDWRGVLMADIAGARMILRKLLASKVRFVPEVVDRRAGFRLEATGTVESLLTGRVVTGERIVASPNGRNDAFLVALTAWFARKAA